MALLDGKNLNKDRWSLSFISTPEDELVQSENGELTSIWSLEWMSLEHAKDWYNQYARVVGFSTRTQGGTYIRGTKEWKIRTWVCSKEGHRKEISLEVQRERAHTRCGCEAVFSVQRQSNEKWWTWNWNPRHAHPLITPSKVHLLKSHRKINEFHQIECGDTDDAGIQPRLAHELMAIQAGGKKHLGFTHKDLKNYLHRRRNESMGADALQVVLNYFGDNEYNDYKSFFKVQVDESQLIENIFWADHVMQNDYEIFGDFVSFDTTYRTNKENMPLGVFVGVNHHGEQIVFGACLLYSETTASFEWVFQTFLQCMNGKAPKSLFTDQDAAMLAAIPVALPDTKHYLCAWHINQNAMKHLGSLFGNKEFKSAWYELLYNGDILEFDKVWSMFIVDHDLHHNEWLQRIYNRRHMWAPVFVRETFCAGKQTTQLSESFNSRLRTYLKSNMDLGRFFKQFQRAVDFLRNNELESNFQMLNELPSKGHGDPLCNHASTIYTPKIFKLFQNEVIQVEWVKLDSKNISKELQMYVVHNCEDSHDCSKANKHIVTGKFGFYSCSCKKFTFAGIICCHIIFVMKRTGKGFLSRLPDEYIIPRWTRNARSSITSSTAVIVDSEIEGAIRYRRYTNSFACAISKYVSNPNTWDSIEHCLATLNNDLEKFSVVGPNDVDKPNKFANISNVVHVDGQDVVVKGLRKKELRFKGNKRLKSCLELRKQKRSFRSQSLSQPAVRRQLAIEDVKDDEEDDLECSRFRTLGDLMEDSSSTPH